MSDSRQAAALVKVHITILRTRGLTLAEGCRGDIHGVRAAARLGPASVCPSLEVDPVALQVVQDPLSPRYAAALRWLLGAINRAPTAFGQYHLHVCKKDDAHPLS